MHRSRRGGGKLGVLTQTATALAALGALVFTGVSLTVTRDQNEAQNNLTAQNQYTDRYTKAIEQLGQQGADRLQIRLGGIYALERLARDSPRDQPTIIEVLSAFVRTNNPRTANDKVSLPPTTDTGAALSVLGRRNPLQDDVTHIDLHGSSLKNTELSGASLSGADLGYASLGGANLNWATLSGATLTGADLVYASLGGANLGGATLSGATLIGANLASANLSSTYLAWADLRDADLRGANLDRADLRDTRLSDTDLRATNLGGADLSRADLRSADLGDANLSDADLRGADLRGADLGGTYLSRADLRGADLRGAKHNANTRIDQILVDDKTRWW